MYCSILTILFLIFIYIILCLQRGERVHVLEATSGGIWKGQIDNRVGFFHFNFVDMITESTPTNHRKDKSRRRMNRRSKPQTVEELLQRIGLEVYMI